MAERGNVMEDGFTVPFLTQAIEALGGKLHFAGQSEQKTYFSKKLGRSATPDGFATGMPDDALSLYGVPSLEGTGCFLVEFKSIDDRYNKKNLPKEPHRYQVQQGMGLMRMGKQKHKPLYALIVYVDCSDYADLSCFVVRFDEELFERHNVRAKHILESDPEALMPEGKMRGGKDCKYCPFSVRCLGYAAWVPQKRNDVPPETVKSLEARALYINSRKEELAYIEQELGEHEGLLKAELASTGSNYLPTDKVELSWSQTAGRGSTDYKAMAEELKKRGGNPDAFKKEGKPSEKLSITVKGHVGKALEVA